LSLLRGKYPVINPMPKKPARAGSVRQLVGTMRLGTGPLGKAPGHRA